MSVWESWITRISSSYPAGAFVPCIGALAIFIARCHHWTAFFNDKIEKTGSHVARQEGHATPSPTTPVFHAFRPSFPREKIPATVRSACEIGVAGLRYMQY